MQRATSLLVLALAMNVIALVPFVTVLLADLQQAERGAGPVTDGRLILTSVYMAIALVSAALIVLHQRQLAWAVPMTVALFAVRITYKLVTVAMVSLSNPVVIPNLGAVALQAAVLAVFWTTKRKRPATA